MPTDASALTTTSVGVAITAAFAGLWIKVITFVPEVIVAIIVLIVGYAIARFLGSLAERFVRYMRLDRLVQDTGVEANSRRYGIDLRISYIVGFMVRWFIILMTLITAADILQLERVTDFLNAILFYIPNVIAAVLILTIGFVAGEFVARMVRASLRVSELFSAEPNLLASAAKYVIVLFAGAAALNQLDIAPHIVEIVVGGVVLALALAFGLGGREQASRMLDRMSPRAPRTPAGQF